MLVNNAAFQLHVSRFEDLTEAHFDKTHEDQPVRLFPHGAGGGRNRWAMARPSSTPARSPGCEGNKDLLDYSTTKGGIHAFTRSLGTHLTPRGIRVNAVAPGPVWTPLNPADKEAQDVSKFGADTVMKRPAQPEEIAPAYVFLASPQCSSYITGEILPIIGGYGGG